MKFPDKLQYLRIKKGLTAEELAVLANVTPASISYYENGKRKPHINTLSQLAKVLDVTPEELITETTTE